MLDPEAPDAQRDKIVADARGRIEASGQVKQDSAWGLRQMAYEIRRRTEADYRFFRFEGDAELLNSLDHELKIADGVLRFRIFKVDARSPVIVPPAPSPGSGPPPRPGRRGDEESVPAAAEAETDAPAAETPAEEAPSADAQVAEAAEESAEDAEVPAPDEAAPSPDAPAAEAPPPAEEAPGPPPAEEAPDALARNARVAGSAGSRGREAVRRLLRLDVEANTMKGRAKWPRATSTA